MTRLCFQYLTIFGNENVPNSIQIVPKWAENFAQNQINLKYIAKDFKLFAKVVEFRQIWSHCTWGVNECEVLRCTKCEDFLITYVY